MRRVILYIAVSLDGYIAGKNDDLSWLFTDSDYGFAEFYSGIDTVLTGRKTYDISLKLGEKFENKTVYVFSKKPGNSEPHINFISSGIPELVKDIKTQSGKDIWLLGGGEIVSLFQAEDLIDKYIISVHPVILGEGIPLFQNIHNRKMLKTVECRKFDSGLVQLIYNNDIK